MLKYSSYAGLSINLDNNWRNYDFVMEMTERTVAMFEIDFNGFK